MKNVYTVMFYHSSDNKPVQIETHTNIIRAKADLHLLVSEKIRQGYSMFENGLNRFDCFYENTFDNASWGFSYYIEKNGQPMIHDKHYYNHL